MPAESDSPVAPLFGRMERAGEVAKIRETDRELMLAVGEGRLELMEALFDRHHVRMYRFFRRTVGRPDQCHDLVQSLFLRMLQYRRSYRGRSHFSTWMYRIALNLRSDHLRASRREGMVVALDVLEETAAPPAAGVTREQRSQLRTALDSLSRSDRDLLTLVKFEGLSYVEVAEIRGCTIGSLKVRVHRALQRLRRQLRPGTVGPETGRQG